VEQKSARDGVEQKKGCTCLLGVNGNILKECGIWKAKGMQRRSVYSGGAPKGRGGGDCRAAASKTSKTEV
jgi:hypothetical protein